MLKNIGPFGRYEPGSVGYILNALYHFGVPLNFVESVTVGNSRVLLGDKLVCTYIYMGDNQILFDFSAGIYPEHSVLRDHEGRFQLTYSNSKMYLTFCVPVNDISHRTIVSLRCADHGRYHSEDERIATFHFSFNELSYVNANEWVTKFNECYRELELFEQGVTKHGRRLTADDDLPSYAVNSVVAHKDHSLQSLWTYLEDHIFPEIADGELFVTYKGCTCVFKRGVEFAEFASLFPKGEADTTEPAATSADPVVGYTLADMDLDDVLPH